MPDQTALEYWTKVMNDPNSAPDRRDLAAELLLKYAYRTLPGSLHAPKAQPIGKKAEAQARAQTVAEGSDWEGDLPNGPLN